MKLKLIIPALLLTTLLGAQGIRKEAGNTFLEPLQKRDSVLIADQFRYGIVLENVPEGTPLALGTQGECRCQKNRYDQS